MPFTADSILIQFAFGHNTGKAATYHWPTYVGAQAWALPPSDGVVPAFGIYKSASQACFIALIGLACMQGALQGAGGVQMCSQGAGNWGIVPTALWPTQN